MTSEFIFSSIYCQYSRLNLVLCSITKEKPQFIRMSFSFPKKTVLTRYYSAIVVSNKCYSTIFAIRPYTKTPFPKWCILIYKQIYIQLDLYIFSPNYNTNVRFWYISFRPYSPSDITFGRRSKPWFAVTGGFTNKSHSLLAHSSKLIRQIGHLTLQWRLTSMREYSCESESLI